MDTLQPLNEQTPPGESFSARPEPEEREAIRRALLRRLRWDGFGGWLLVFFCFLTFDLSAWGQSIPLLVESIRFGQPLALILAVYAFTRLWLFGAALRLLRRAPGAARSVRFALAARMGFAVLLLFVGFLLLSNQSASARNLMALAVLSMACDVAWWFYFRLSRRVRTVLEARERPQPPSGPEASCPPYGAPEEEGAPLEPEWRGESAPSAQPAPSVRAGGQPAEPPALAWMVLGAALLIVIWQAWRSAFGLNGQLSMLLFLPLDRLLMIQDAWITVASFFMTSLSPLISVSGFCLIFGLLFRVRGGRELALRLGKLRIAYWALSAALAIAIVATWEPQRRLFHEPLWWFLQFGPTLVFEIALYGYARNARALRAAFTERPGAKALADHCARRVSGPDAAARLAAATWRAEREAFTGLHGWLLFFCGACAYSAVFFIFQMPVLNPLPFLLNAVAPFLPPETPRTAQLSASLIFACLALVHAAACLLVLSRSRVAKLYARGLQLALIFLCLAVGLSALLSGSGAWMQTGMLFIQSFFSLFPAMALAFGWYRYFGASRRVFLTLPRASFDNSKGDI